MNRMPRVLMVQLGRRHHYAFPASLSKLGMLERFYTDCASDDDGSVLYRYHRNLLSLISKGGFNARTLPEPVAKATCEFPFWFWGMTVLTRSRLSTESRARVAQYLHKLASRSMLRAGFGQSTHLLTMFGEAIPLMKAAKKSGVITITDINIALSTPRILAQAQLMHPGWDNPNRLVAPTTEGSIWGQVVSSTLEYTDYFLCPSAFVRNDLIDNFGVLPDRAILLPYPISKDWLAFETAPEIGRIFFAGEASLRKGVHVLAACSKVLALEAPDIRIVLAGVVSRQVRERVDCENLIFLGQISSDQMKMEMARADIFVLPSLAEGSAGVTYEALASGLPVVTTLESGSPVVDGVQGIVVPASNSEELVSAILQIVRDRELRSSMSQAARLMASNFTWERFQKRLGTAISEMSEE